MEIRKNVSLQDKHTFGLPWKSRFFCELTKKEQIPNFLNFAKENKVPVLILGGGSNLLPTEKFKGLVIQNKLTGKEILKETKDAIILQVAAGEDWHKLVMWSLRKNMYGLENLSLIPGTVGGAVVQNIGAYDVDIQRFVTEVIAYSLVTGKKKVFTHKECKFDYRNSLFKSSDKWLVVSVTLALPKKFTPVLTYKPLWGLKDSTSPVTAKQVSQEVIKIRRSKLPDWKKIGTAGSFFANPRISKTKAEQLKKHHPDIPLFNNYGSKKITVPAGWLVEHSSLSLKNREEFLYHKHALIIVNNDKGGNVSITKGKRTHAVITRIQNKVSQEFGVLLRPEVRIF